MRWTATDLDGRDFERSHAAGPQSALTYPTSAQTAGAAAQSGTQITRRNLNVQPTIKIPAGFKFTVGVNRDIVFEAPYETVVPDRQPKNR
jgi:type IV secretion system protein VirB10